MSSERYTDRQLGILKGIVTDLSDSEIDWYDQHGSDVIEGDDGLKHLGNQTASRPEEPPPPPEFTALSPKPPQPFVPPTFVSETARALEEKEDD